MNRFTEPAAWQSPRRAIAGLAAAAACVAVSSQHPAIADGASASLPSPNGFDYAVKATSLVVEAPLVTSYTPAGLRDPATMAAATTILQQNGSAIDLVRESFRYSYRTPPMKSMADLYPYLAKYRSIARVLAFQANVDAARGDLDGTVQSSLDAVELGQEVPRGAPLIHDLVGIACDAVGRRALWGSIGSLDAGQCRAAIKRLQDIEAKHVPLADTIAVEKADGHTDLNTIFQSPAWQSEMVKEFTSPEGSDANQLRQQLQGIGGDPKAIVANYDACMDAEIAIAGLPYGAPHPTRPTPNTITRIMMPDYEKVRFKDAQSETETALLTTALALHAYKLDHGSFPVNLQALTPDYLSSVPADPFGSGAPLHYRETDEAPILYSVGPDGRDDGGKPVNNQSAGNPTTVTLESTGDIVAGLNGW